MTDFAPVSYRWAIQVAGCPVLWLSHADAPTLNGSPLDHEGGNYLTRPHCLSADTSLYFARQFDIDVGVIGQGNVKVVLQCDRRNPATCPFRHIGTRGFRGMPWKARLLADVSAEDDAPELVIEDVGQTIAEGDIIHIGPEAFLVDSVDDLGSSLSIQVDTRAVLGTERITHRTDPRIDDVPYVTPVPLTWRGRRALVWRVSGVAPRAGGQRCGSRSVAAALVTSATMRPTRRSLARNTAPMPPSPMRPSMT